MPDLKEPELKSCEAAEPGAQIRKAGSKSPWSEEDKAECKRLYIHGHTLDDISEHKHVPKKTLQHWQAKDHWTLLKVEKQGISIARQLEHQTGNCRSHVPSSDDDQKIETEKAVEEFSKLTLVDKQFAYEEAMQAQAIRLPRLIALLSEGQLLMQADKLKNLDAIVRRALRLEQPAPAPVMNIGINMATPLPPPAPVALLSNEVQGAEVEHVQEPPAPASNTGSQPVSPIAGHTEA